MPEHLLPLPDGWWGSPAAQDARHEARAPLADLIGLVEEGAVLALKDPRMTLLLPLWTGAAADLGLSMRVVLCLRHPGEVAASLTRCWPRSRLQGQ